MGVGGARRQADINLREVGPQCHSAGDGLRGIRGARCGGVERMCVRPGGMGRSTKCLGRPGNDFFLVYISFCVYHYHWCPGVARTIAVLLEGDTHAGMQLYWRIA